MRLIGSRRIWTRLQHFSRTASNKGPREACHGFPRNSPSNADANAGPEGRGFESSVAMTTTANPTLGEQQHESDLAQEQDHGPHGDPARPRLGRRSRRSVSGGLPVG